jgi:hypothetical protein
VESGSNEKAKERIAMKVAFVICNDVYAHRVMELLDRLGIDYYTRWEQVKGKGHGTDPHLGTRSFPGTNAVLMIAFEDESRLDKLILEIIEANRQITRPDDRIRLFQLPLDRIV